MITPESTPIIAAVAASTALLLLASLRALGAARAKERQTRELAIRSQQLSLLNRLSFLFAQESRRRGVADAATEFLVREMGAGRAIYWRPDSGGEPDMPWLRFPAEDEPECRPALPEIQRIILARTAARGDVPLVLQRDSDDQRPRALMTREAPPSDFVVYVPLRGGTPREGVLEIYSGIEPWSAEQWELLLPLAAHLGGALQRARHYEGLREQADVDYVTGLYNHRFMQSYLQSLVSAEADRGRNFAVLLMDIDGFKQINDRYGHSVGDRVLQAVADQLKLTTEHVGVVGRFGGDEFVVVLPNHARQEAGALVQAFQDWLSNYTLTTPSGRSVPIHVSCGLAVFPEDGSQRQELIAAADARLYQRKRPGPQLDRASVREDEMGSFGFLKGLVSSVDSVDHYTRAHCENTAEKAVTLAQHIGLSPSAQRTLRLAALLHDVGKICIPDDILRKPGALTSEELAVMKHHVYMAEHLIVDVPNAEEVRNIARHHHERFDGSGYPDGLRGEEIPLLARILSVADAFSAMTLDRPHREGLSPEEAYSELKRVAGSQLDLKLVQAFVQALEEPKDEPELMAALAQD